MALQEELTLTSDGDYIIKAKNARDGTLARYHIGAYDNFGGGTLTIGITYDNGTTIVTDISDTATTSFTDNFSRLVEVPSAELDGAAIVLTLTGSSGANLNVRVYNER